MSTIQDSRATVPSPADGPAGTEPPSTTEPAATAPPGLTPDQRRRKALLRFAISITLLNVVGHLVLGFEQPPIVPILAVLVSYAAHLGLEAVDAWAHRRPPEYAGGPREVFYFLLPAHIAALACAMLLFTSSIWPYLFAVVAAAASKYLFRVRVKGRLRHFLNPSNLGISVVLLTMPLVGFTPPYMFLNNTDQTLDVLIPLVVLTAGTLLNGKLTRKMPLILGWVGGYVLQAVLRTVFFDDVLLATLGMMTGVPFVLYMNYMITDPGTSPVDPRRQVVFGVSVALVYGALVVAQVAYAIFFALVLVCAVRGLLLFLGERGLALPAGPSLRRPSRGSVPAPQGS